MISKKYNRRNFFRITGAGAFVATAVLWDKLVLAEKKLSENRVVTIPFDQNKNINFHQDFIIVNERGLTRVFSSHCTHLGCVINQSKDTHLLCPCHGSMFNKNGEPLTGPATKSLKELDFEIDPKSLQITVKI